MVYAPSATAILAAALVFVGAVDALPPRIGTTVTNNTASITQVRNPNYAGRHGPLALAKAYNKFGKALPKELDAAVSRIRGGSKASRSTGSAVTTPVSGDVQWLTPVKIGTPAQTLNLDFDTGSSDLWVFSSETPKSSVNGQAIYTPTKSSTAKTVSGATWSISYGDGSSCSGNVFKDTVSIGGLTVKNQAVEAAKKVSSSFASDSDNDGLVGLAFSSINTVTPTQQTTFFDTAMSSLGSPVFTADLKTGAPGTYNFGFIDTDIPTSDIAYTAVDSSQGFWTFSIASYSVNGQSGDGFSGIADTGTTLLLLPDEVVEAYYNSVDGAQNDSSQGGYTFSCSAELPDFSFVVESQTITVPGSYINFAPTDNSGETCFGGLQSSSDIGINIFGDVALKAAFVVFDGGNTQLGWATKNL